MLTLQALGPLPQLNSFTTVGTYEFASGSDNDIYLRIITGETKLRYIPLSGSTYSIVLENSDGSTVTKTPTNPFPDDRSILKFSITAAESLLIISQNIVLTMVEGGKTYKIIMKNGLSKTGGDCCG